MAVLSKPDALSVIERINKETTVRGKLIGSEGKWMVMVHNENFLLQLLYEGWHTVEKYERPVERPKPSQGFLF